MKIVKLVAENFKKLIAVEITPEGNVVRITGKNGAGKSSVLDAVCVALCGKNVSPKKPIRNGEERAVIVVDLGDIVVTRKFTATNSYLEVVNKNGFKATSPQAILDKLVGAVAFDPLAFFQKSDREQRQILIDLMGVDVSIYDDTIRKLADERKALLAQKKEAELDLSRMPYYADVPTKEVSMAELVQRIEEANRTNKEYERLKDQADTLLKDLVSLKEQMDALEARRTTTEEGLRAVQDKLAQTKPTDISNFRREVAKIETQNEWARKNQQYATAKANISKLAEEINAKFHEIGAAEKAKAKALADVTMPMEGLSVDEGGVVYEGIPLSQVNHAKRLEVSMAIQMALNPTLRVILANGNGLDSETMAVITKLAKDKDYQVWLEQANESGEVGVYIEDGGVVAIDGKRVGLVPAEAIPMVSEIT